MSPRLVAITDRSVADALSTLSRFRELGWLAKPGTVVFQLRDVDLLAARERLEFGAAIQRIARESGQLFVVNDRIDLAVVLGADGVHLGEAGVETSDARRLLGEGALVSRACHDLGDLATVKADVVLLSPIVEPRKGRAPLGLKGLREARRLLQERRRAPHLLALGGVSAKNAGACRAAGADGVAVVGALFGNTPLSELVDAVGATR